MLVICVSILTLDRSDDSFLEQMQKDAFQYFWEQVNVSVGQVKDRAFASGSADNRPVASVASTGFGLAAIAIAVERSYIKRNEAEKRVETTLSYILNNLTNVHGFYYHFVDMNTGERVWNCELSSIDSTLMFAGVLVVRQYFKYNKAIYDMATEIYNRVDWPWFLDGHDSLSMGWTPEGGFLTARWNTYCELLLIYVLGIGSPSHPLDVKTWDSFTRPNITFQNYTYIDTNAPLFTHQFSHAFIDLRKKSDQYGIDYYENSVIATQAHKAFCLSLNSRFSSYTNDQWGITASDYIGGYVAWGGPPERGPLDGTIVPCACGGAIPFHPDCIRVLKNIKTKYPETYKKYSFVDAFNPINGWITTDSLGIDLGITLIMSENYRSNFVWNYFMQNEEVRHAMDKIRFRSNGHDALMWGLIGGGIIIIVSIVVSIVIFYKVIYRKKQLKVEQTNERLIDKEQLE